MLARQMLTEYTCRMAGGKCFGKVCPPPIPGGSGMVNLDYWACTHCGARYHRTELPFLEALDDADAKLAQEKYDARKAAGTNGKKVMA